MSQYPQNHITLEKEVGQTPLSCAEEWRAAHPQYADAPLAYAGRLDPMASGKLLILIGDECKNQTAYHGLDKAYDFSVLFGIESDTQDVLGRLQSCLPVSVEKQRPAAGGFGWGAAGADDSRLLEDKLRTLCQQMEGNIELPYPHFSSKTIQGKPLHMWTLEGRLDEITIPTKESEIYSLQLQKIEKETRLEVAKEARTKIDTIPEVTDPKKALGNDFRRVDVREDWEQIAANDSLPQEYTIAHFHCIASSGTYMRTLASVVAEKLGTCGLAWHIHRTNIGKYQKETEQWVEEY